MTWQDKIKLLNQGISPDNLPFNPPKQSIGKMAEPDGDGGFIFKERFLAEDPGHYKYFYFNNDGLAIGWITIKKVESPNASNT